MTFTRTLLLLVLGASLFALNSCCSCMGDSDKAANFKPAQTKSFK